MSVKNAFIEYFKLLVINCIVFLFIYNYKNYIQTF